MSTFYFLYFYIAHSLFTLNIVFIPSCESLVDLPPAVNSFSSVLAAILASVPLLPAYSVAVLGVIELYVVRGEVAAAVVFVLVSVTPFFAVDSVFYSEVQ